MRRTDATQSRPYPRQDEKGGETGERDVGGRPEAAAQPLNTVSPIVLRQLGQHAVLPLPEVPSPPYFVAGALRSMVPLIPARSSALPDWIEAASLMVWLTGSTLAPMRVSTAW